MTMCCGQEIPETLPENPNKKIVFVVAAAMIEDGRILITQRPDHKAMANLWEFPGGKIEAGETPEYALCRELKEELGIMTTESCLYPLTFASHSYDDFHLMMPVFVLRRWEGMPQLNEHKDMQWVEPMDLYNYEMPEADRPLIPTLIDYLSS